MRYFDNKQNVKAYIKMTEGNYSGALIKILKTYLPVGSTLLELGMGPGKDLDILKQYYVATGSDYAQLFLDIYKRNHPDADVLLLDAATMDTTRKFNGIYSNKVLSHLTREQFKSSLTKQKDVLTSEGILFHTLWYGEKDEIYRGLKFVYYTVEMITKLVKKDYDILELEFYSEIAKDDSLYFVLRKKA